MENLCVFTNADSTIILSSKIIIDKTVCSEQDYFCLYWKTDQQFSDKEIGCYTPEIPPEKRLLLTSTNTRFKVSISVINPITKAVSANLTCPTENNCVVYYNSESTPEILSIIPQNFYFGYPMLFRIDFLV